MLDQLQGVLVPILGIVCGLLGLLLTLGLHRPGRWRTGWREICLEVCGLVLLMLAWLLLGAWVLR